MAGQWTQPELLTKVNGSRRGYGRQDYLRFDHIASSHMPAGRGKIGQIQIDCRFIFTKSLWGYLGMNLGNTNTPAGIVYLDLDFHQPSDCRLRSATIVVTLDEHDEKGRHIVTDRSTCPVKFTNHYGPSGLRGRERPVHKRHAKSFTPSFQIMGFGIGGVGVTEEQTAVSGSRWSFSGHLGRSKGSPWDNKLQWHLDENVQEAQPMHSNVIHTAFALEHNASMFYMTVEVTGRLQDTSDRIINKLRFGGKKDSVTTKIHWKEPYSSRLWLDKIARDLPLAMEYENMSKVPVEVPDASSAEFRPSNHPSSSASADSQQALGQENGGAWMTPEIPADTHASLLGRGDTLHLPELTLENMCMAAGLPVPDASSSTAGRPGTTHQATRPSKAVTRGYADDGNTARFLPLGLTKWESLSFDRVLGDADVMLLVQWLGKCSVAIFAFVAGLFGLPLYTWACSWYAESPRGFEVKEDQSSLGRKGMNGLPSEKDLLDQDELDGDTLVPPSRGTPSLVASGLGTQGWGSESKKSRKSLVVNWDPATRDIPSYEHQSTGNDRRAMYAPRPPPGRSATTKPPAILKKSGLLPDIDEMCAEDISPVPVVKRGLRDGDVAVPGRDPRGVEGNNIGEGGGDGDLDFSTNKSEEIGD